MELRVRSTASCKKAWRQLHIGVHKAIKAAIKKLARGEVQGEPLTQDLADHRSLHVENHRAIYRIIDNTVVVVAVGHRSTVYADARRLLGSGASDELEPL